MTKNNATAEPNKLARNPHSNASGHVPGILYSSHSLKLFEKVAINSPDNTGDMKYPRKLKAICDIDDPNALSRLGTASMNIPVKAGKHEPPKNNKNQMQPITNHIPPAGQNVAENANIFDITAKPVTKLTLLNFCSGDERYPPILSTAHPPNRTPKTGPVAEVTMKHNMTVCTGYLCGPFIK